MIQTRNLVKTFKNSSNEDVKVLDNVSIDVEKGDIYGIIGMSGAGKSTLLRCVGLLEEASSGEILIEGKNIANYKGKELLDFRKDIGIIFQGYHLLQQKTVFKNIAFPLEISGWKKADIKERVNELLDLVGLSDKGDSYPAQLSGGQKQRVAIARALANNAKILLCDEPTSALDLVTIKSILELLKKINKELGITVLIITHELSVITSVCNKVAVIDGGVVIEEGEVSEVFGNPQENLTKELVVLGGGK